eukprot:scaffold2072_cov126-Isochrysis_galbana.AAC.9
MISRWPAEEAMFTTCPPGRSSGRKASVTASVPQKFVASVCWACSPNGVRFECLKAMPALLTRTSRPPCSARTASTHSEIDLSDVTSSCWKLQQTDAAAKRPKR